LGGRGVRARSLEQVRCGSGARWQIQLAAAVRGEVGGWATELVPPVYASGKAYLRLCRCGWLIGSLVG
jgi:hypothetical protein